MKKIYMIPSISVVSHGVQAVCRLNGGSGLQEGQNGYGGTGAKENDFSSWITVSMRRIIQNLIPEESRSGIK